MAHEVETQSPAITPAAVAPARRKRVILLCCEDLRPIACSLEHALEARGWDVTVEFGQDARPWVQKTELGGPSLRVLCVPGRVDRELADTLRAAYAPSPDADLHIVGVDDSRGLVQEIERLAGVRKAPRRPLTARPRLSHDTMIEAGLRRERSWLVGTSAGLAAFALTLGGIAITQLGSTEGQPLTLPSASITTSFSAHRFGDDGMAPRVDEPRVDEPTFDEPVLAAVAPPAFDDWEDELPPEEEPDEDDYEIVIFDDEPTTTHKAIEVTAPPLADPLQPPTPVEAVSTPSAFDALESVIDDLEPQPELPSSTETPIPPGLELPTGFLPVAGFSVAAAPPPLTLQDPFAELPITATSPISVDTVDPFASPADHPPTP